MSKKHKEMIERTGTRALQWKAELSLKKKKKVDLADIWLEAINTYMENKNLLMLVY